MCIESDTSKLELALPMMVIGLLIVRPETLMLCSGRWMTLDGSASLITLKGVI